MHKRTKALQVLTALVLALLALGPVTSQSVVAQVILPPKQSESVVIYEAYGGGGNKESLFKFDFFVLFNLSNATVDLTGWKVRGYNNTGEYNYSPTALSGEIAAGGYYLIQEAEGGTGSLTPLPTPDAIGNMGLGATTFSVVLINEKDQAVDTVGFGSTALTYEGNRALGLSNSTAGMRKDPCIDTGKNADDFMVGAPSPKNSASPKAPCGIGVSSVNFEKNTDGQARVDTAFTLTFTKPVTFSTASITCNSGAPITITPTPVTATDPTAGDTQWAVTPPSALPYASTCSLDVAADAVYDLGTPPAPMAAAYNLAFDTEPEPPAHSGIISVDFQQDSYGIFPTSTIVVTFNQPVTPGADWYSLVCNNEPVTAAFSPETAATAFTITPSSALPYNASCSFSVFADKVEPVMAADYVLENLTVRANDDAAPAFIGSVPAANATGVLPEATISLTYNEDVIYNGGASLNCGGSDIAVVGAAMASDPKTLVLTPSTLLPAGSTCNVSVPTAAVSDLDQMDPPDNPETSLAFSFTTLNTIMQVQGSGSATSMNNQTVTVRGVVTAMLPNFRGYGLQDLNGDGDPATSDGIFVFTGSYSPLPGLNIGDVIQITGKVSEYFEQTQISASTFTKLSTEPIQPTPTSVSLPLTTAQRESLEGMLVTFPQALTISEYYNYGRYGTIALTGSRHYIPTSIFPPGAAAVAELERQFFDTILLDDASNAENPATLRHPDGSVFSLTNRFRGGDTLTGMTGFMHYSFDEYKIQPTTGALYTAINARPPAPEITPGELRVASMNVLNYFTSVDAGPDICGPGGNLDCRGADTAEELTRQRTKILAALTGMEADIVGLVEIENDRQGFAPDYAALDLVDGINAHEGGTNWKVVSTGAVGTDAIKVALIYDSSKVTAVGAPAIITAADGFDVTVQRPAVAQTFRDHASNELLTIAVNHLKSKGSACDGDPDMGDGQGNCPNTRTDAAKALVTWLSNDPTNQGSDQFLIIGDLNAYPLEDPIEAIQLGPDGVEGTADDFINTVMRFSGQHAYSYGFDGAISYLDHGLANRRLASYILDADYWHINADEPSVLDYDMTFKKPEVDLLYEPNAYRASDHDPILISLLLNHPPMAVDDFYQTYANTTLSVNDLDGVSANDVEVNKYDKVSFSLVTPPAHGTVVLNADGSFVYTPNAFFAGQDTFTYSMDTEYLFRTQSTMNDTATVTIDVIATGNIPVAVVDTYTVDAGNTLTVAAPGVLSNDTDADGSSLTAVLVSNVSNGTLTLNANGSFTYVPKAGFFGNDTFTYKANDGETDSNVATVTIHVLERKFEPLKIFLPIIKH